MIDASPYLGLGLQLGFTMVVFSGAGYLLDVWLHTLPWFTIAGAASGMVALVAQLVRVSNSSTGQRGKKKSRNTG